MVIGFFRKIKNLDHRFNKLNSSLDNSFNSLKDDMENVAEWINHLDTHKHEHSRNLRNIDSRLRAIEEFIQTLTEKQDISKNKQLSKQLSKHTQTVVRSKQLSESVQTAVQTDIEKALYSLTAMERTVVWALLNTDMRLSYGDLKRVLGKDESTVRGQINNIKRKIPGLVSERSESNGKKRFYIKRDKKESILAKYVPKKAKIGRK